MPTTGNRFFRVFISSTFSDFAAERNALERDVFPRLRTLCGSHGASFQAIDLRWGISESASRDQRAVRVCLEEIARCQRISPRPNFICLIGDRYGFRPLPDEIDAAEFDLLCMCSEDATLLDKWYRLDTNAVPPVRVLNPRSSENADWETARERILQLLEGAAERAGLPRQRRILYGSSATEQEIERGVLTPPGTEEHVFAFFRAISGLPIADGVILDPTAVAYVDAVGDRLDSAAAARLRSLRERLSQRLGSHARVYSATWTPSGPTDTHVEALCNDVYESLAEVISAQIAELEEVAPLDKEVAEHEHFLAERVRVFVGRTSLLSTIADYLACDSPHPLVIEGSAGAGKSALMAQAATVAAGQGVPVLIRFAGVTPSSSRERELLTGILAEAARKQNEPPVELPDSRDRLVAVFCRELAKRASTSRLAVFVDGIDQMQESDVPWIIGESPPGLRLVVSVREGTVAAVTLGGRVPADHHFILPTLSSSETSDGLDRLLANACRTLTPEQRSALLGTVAGRAPLLLRMAFEMARALRSWDPPPDFGADLSSAVRKLVQKLSDTDEHSPLLVERALSLLACARAGLAEEELLDLLSADSEVFEDFLSKAHHALPDRRLPVVLWSRLRLDLEPYLMERLAGGKRLLNFFHRIVNEALVDNLSPEASRARHEALAGYFEAQPLYISCDGHTSPNLRKLGEQAFQQSTAARWLPLAETLTDPRFIEARIRYPDGARFGVHDLAEDCARIEGAPEEQQASIAPLTRALVEQAAVLRIEPELALQQVRNTMIGLPLASKIEEQLSAEKRPWFATISHAGAAPAVRILDAIDTTTTFSKAPAAACGRFVAVVGQGGVQLWDIEQNRRIGMLEPSSIESAVLVRFSQRTNGSLLHVVHLDGATAVWGTDDFEKWKPLHRWRALADINYIFPTRLVIAADVSMEGRFVASLHAMEEACTVGLMISVFELGGVLCNTFDLPFAAKGLAFSPEGGSLTLAIVGGEFDRHAGGIEGDLARGFIDELSGQIVKSDWHGLVGGAKLMLVDLRTMNRRYVPLPSMASLTAVAWVGGVGEIGLIAVGDRLGSVAILDLKGRVRTIFPSRLVATPTETIADLRPPELRHGFADTGHEGAIRTLRFSQDGRWLASASGDSFKGNVSELRMWSLEEERLDAQIPLGYDIDSIEVLSPMKLIVSGPKLLAQVNILPRPSRRVAFTRVPNTLAISGQGDWLAYDDGIDIVVSHGGTRHVVECAHFAEILCLAWHPSKHVLASGGADGFARLWDAATGELQRELPWGGDSVTSIRFSPDGTFVALSGDGGHCHVVPLDGSPPRDLVNADKGLKCLAIDSDGHVASGSDSGLIYLWDAGGGQVELAGHLGAVRGVDFIGDRLVSTGVDGTLRIWDLGSRKELRRVSTSSRLQLVFSASECPVAIAAADNKAIAITIDRERPIAKVLARAKVLGGIILAASDRVCLVDALGEAYEFRLRPLLGGEL